MYILAVNDFWVEENGGLRKKRERRNNKEEAIEENTGEEEERLAQEDLELEPVALLRGALGGTCPTKNLSCPPSCPTNKICGFKNCYGLQ